MDTVDWSVLSGRVFYGSLEPPNKKAEMLQFEFSEGEHPRLVRIALEALKTLHETSRREYLSVMANISRDREYHLRRLELRRDTFPSFFVELTTMNALLGAEQFFQSTGFNPSRKIDLCFRIHIWKFSRTPRTEAELLSQLIVVMQLVKEPTSPFDVTGITIEYRNCPLSDEATMRLATQLNKLILCDNSFTPVYSVLISLDIISLLDSTGEFFQSLCRVGCDDRHRPRRHHSSNLYANYGGSCDSCVLAMFASAVAYSRGFTYCGVAEELASSGEMCSATAMKYLVLASLCRTSEATEIGWFKHDLNDTEIAAFEEVSVAAQESQNQLTQLLWDGEWRKDRDRRVFEVSSLNVDILKKHGLILDDPLTGAWIDVFVPGYAQCSVKRDQWRTIVGDNKFVEKTSICSPRIRKLGLRTQSQEAQVIGQLSRLFCVIGRSLVELNLDLAVLALDLVSIFESCPRLQILRVEKFQLLDEAVDVNPDLLKSTSISSICIALNNTTSPATSATDDFFSNVFPVIGSSLASLCIKSSALLIPFSRSFTALIRSCRRLQQIELQRLDIPSLDPLTDLCRRGEITLFDLKIYQCPIDLGSLERFAACLGDESQRLGATLTTFRCSRPGRSGSTASDSCVRAITALTQMLETNTILEELIFTVARSSSDWSIYRSLSTFEARFAAFNDQELPLPRPPIPLVSTLALLTGLKNRGFPWSPETFKLIVSFAARRPKRTVKFYIA